MGVAGWRGGGHHGLASGGKNPRAATGRCKGKVNCAILLLGIGGVLISLSKAMSP